MRKLHLDNCFTQPEPDEATSLTSGSWRRGTPRGVLLTRQVKRSRRSGRPLDIGFDLKGATTDCLKKCATLIGVGLYLTRKEEPAPAAIQDQTDQPSPAPDGSPPGVRCADCGKALNKRVRLRDGTVWTPAMLAEHGRSKHGRVLCPADLRAADQPNGAVASEDGGR